MRRATSADLRDVNLTGVIGLDAEFEAAHPATVADATTARMWRPPCSTLGIMCKWLHGATTSGTLGRRGRDGAFQEAAAEFG